MGIIAATLKLIVLLIIGVVLIGVIMASGSPANPDTTGIVVVAIFAALLLLMAR